MIKCVKCGTELNDGTKFCTECGAPQEPEQVDVAAAVEVRCAGCGAALEADSKFCTSCGSPASEAEIGGSVAAAQPVASGVTAAAAGPLYPTSTPQGYRCPSCSAFLQPGSTFCATCGTQFAQGVPYGGPAAHGGGGMSPAIPFTIAAILLVFAGIGGYWWYSHRSTTTGPIAGVTTTTSGGTTALTTGGVIGDEAPALKTQVASIFTAVYKGEGISAIYNNASLGDHARGKYPSVDTFVADFQAGMGGGAANWDLVRGAVHDIQPGDPQISGDTAIVPITFSLNIPAQGIRTFTALAKMVKDAGVWKLDFRGSEMESQKVMLDFMGLTAIMAGGVGTPPDTTGGTDVSSGAATGSTGDFNYSTGTTGVGTTG